MNEAPSFYFGKLKQRIVDSIDNYAGAARDIWLIKKEQCVRSK